MGIPAALYQIMTVLPADIDLVEQELNQGDVAGVILEPTGASMGLVPLPEGF